MDRKLESYASAPTRDPSHPSMSTRGARWMSSPTSWGPMAMRCCTWVTTSLATSSSRRRHGAGAHSCVFPSWLRSWRSGPRKTSCFLGWTTLTSTSVDCTSECTQTHSYAIWLCGSCSRHPSESEGYGIHSPDSAGFYYSVCCGLEVPHKSGNISCICSTNTWHVQKMCMIEVLI